MTGIIWACVATLLVACAPILAKSGTKKTDPALSGCISGIVFCAVVFFYAKNQITGSNYAAIGQRGWIFILLAGLATGLFGICFFKSAHEGDISGVVSIVKASYVIMLIASVFLFHHNIVMGDYIVIALMVIGATIININNSGIPFALLGAVCAGCASILISYSGVSMDRSVICFLCLLIGSVLLLLVTIATGGMKKIRSMSFVDGICLILAGVAFPVAYDFYNRAAAFAGNYAAYIFNLALLVLMICASVVLKEKISGKKIIGAIIFIAALFFLI